MRPMMAPWSLAPSEAGRGSRSPIASTMPVTGCPSHFYSLSLPVAAPASAPKLSILAYKPHG